MPQGSDPTTSSDIKARYFLVVFLLAEGQPSWDLLLAEGQPIFFKLLCFGARAGAVFEERQALRPPFRPPRAYKRGLTPVNLPLLILKLSYSHFLLPIIVMLRLTGKWQVRSRRGVRSRP